MTDALVSRCNGPDVRLANGKAGRGHAPHVSYRVGPATSGMSVECLGEPLNA